jgi:hypothetical protein
VGSVRERIFFWRLIAITILRIHFGV